jgi:hypothetical protein
MSFSLIDKVAQLLGTGTQELSCTLINSQEAPVVIANGKRPAATVRRPIKGIIAPNAARATGVNSDIKSPNPGGAPMSSDVARSNGIVKVTGAIFSGPGAPLPRVVYRVAGIVGKAHIKHGIFGCCERGREDGYDEATDYPNP